MSRVLVVGEFYTQEDEANNTPFSGATGGVLRSMLRQAGIDPKECDYTTVFQFAPSRGSVKSLCGKKATGIVGFPGVMHNQFIQTKYFLDLAQFYRTVKNYNPSMIIAAGAVPSWALCQTTGIEKFRGTPMLTTGMALEELGSIKVIPTYSPGDINRNWNLRPIMVADLYKARRDMEFLEVRRPQRTIIIEPDLKELARFNEFLFQDDPILPDLSIDIETASGQITCIGFAPSRDLALVVPIIDPTKPDGNYWPNLTAELRAWHFIRQWCSGPHPKIFQNGLYDIQYLWRVYKIVCRNATNDSMLLHHALQPEMKKSLGFLGSIYTDEPSWKFMRTKHATLKKED